MCGIFLIKNYGNYDYNFINDNFIKGKNRGPDNSKLLCLDNKYNLSGNNYYLGFHRLSINGLNNISNQPFVKNNVYLVCNGEIYNYKQLYEKINIAPVTDSDCEIILDLYLLYPNDFIKYLDGVFSFIIYDTNNGNITIGRDPIGIRPLFYSLDFTCFSSEIKTIINFNKNYNQFPPGHILVNYTFNKYFYINNTIIVNSNNIIDDYLMFCSLVQNQLINAVRKRLLSDRPIACLLSGGLDSSLITSIVSKELNKQIETFSIGLEGSTDLKYAKIVSKYLNTKHTEIILSEDDFFNAIPEVIKIIESYDITTVRASVGNYLVSKYISNNSNAKVIFNGDGSDELTGGYLYFHNCPNDIEFDIEINKLLNNIAYFDVLRSDKSISSCGLEPRTPFLDKSFVTTYLSIPIEHRRQVGQIEKKLLRDSFKGYLPFEVLYRVKEAFSDGVSAENNSWYKIIHSKLKLLELPDITFNEDKPIDNEKKYYKYLYDLNYKNYNPIPYYWMPNWSNTSDPSARTL